MVKLLLNLWFFFISMNISGQKKHSSFWWDWFSRTFAGKKQFPSCCPETSVCLMVHITDRFKNQLVAPISFIWLNPSLVAVSNWGWKEAQLYWTRTSWNNFQRSEKMLTVLAKNNTGIRKSVLQSVSTVCRSSRMGKPVIPYLWKFDGTSF